MELEKGMYVRIKNKIGDCLIGKIVNINDFREPSFKYCIDVQKYDYIFIPEDMIVKASHNIIDLIEKGDIISFNFSDDVYKVLCVPNKKVGCEDFYFEFDLSQELEDVRIKPEIVKEQIKSIVTKEQFESVEYKVERVNYEIYSRR